MKYFGEQIRVWLIDQLSDLKVNDIDIPVKNIAQMGDAAPYVLIINQTQNDTLTKDENSAMATVVIQCVTEFTGNYGGDQFADRIASEVSEKVTGLSGVTEELKVHVMGLDANESTMIIDQTKRVITRQLAFRLLVEQV